MESNRDQFRVSSQMTNSELLTRQAVLRADSIALKDDRRSVTYRELDARVTQLASVFRDRGVGRNDRIAIYMHNRLEIIEVLLGASRCGAIAAPINARLAAPELAYVFDDCQPSAIITEVQLEETVRAAAAPGPPIVLGSGDANDFENLIADADRREHTADVAEDETALLIYTSGTTGRPKGVMLSYRNLLMNSTAVAIARHMQDGQEVGLAGMPLFHAGGISTYFPLLLLGGTAVFVRVGSFDPVYVLDRLRSENVTQCAMVPLQWAALCDVPGAADRKYELRRIIWSAQMAPRSVLEAIHRTFPDADIYCSFGQTETLVTCMLDKADAVRKMGSIGKPLIHVQARLVNDQLEDVGQGEVGELVVRSPSVCQGYWRNSEATSSAFADGWFHSGDLCRADEEGFLYLVDRAKDVIISGGENIYPAEIEAVLLGHPKVGEVAIVGIPHSVWGETPRAVIVAADPGDPPSEFEVIEYCRGRLAGYKRPTSVVVVDALPRNAVGKVVKPLLRQLFAPPAYTGS